MGLCIAGIYGKIYLKYILSCYILSWDILPTVHFPCKWAASVLAVLMYVGTYRFIIWYESVLFWDLLFSSVSILFSIPQLFNLTLIEHILYVLFCMYFLWTNSKYPKIKLVELLIFLLHLSIFCIHQQWRCGTLVCFMTIIMSDEKGGCFVGARIYIYWTCW